MPKCLFFFHVQEMLILKILTCILFEWELWGFLLAAKDSYYDGSAYKEGRAAIWKEGYVWWRGMRCYLDFRVMVQNELL